MPPRPPEPLRFPAAARYTKDDVFEVCGAIAAAESVMRFIGHVGLARRLAKAFDRLEEGLAG